MVRLRDFGERCRRALSARWEALRLNLRFPGWPPLASHFCAFLAGVLLVVHRGEGSPPWVSRMGKQRLLVPLPKEAAPRPSPVPSGGMVHAVRMRQSQDYCRLWEQAAQWWSRDGTGDVVLGFKAWPEPWTGLKLVTSVAQDPEEAWSWRAAAQAGSLPVCRDVERVSYGKS